MTESDGIKVDSWEDLAAKLIGLQDEAPWSARGEARLYPELLSILDRFKEQEWAKHLHSRLYMELVLRDRFVQRAGELVTDVEREHLKADFLAVGMLARHYGVPTRLVDWTESVWIAAYFAAQASPKEEGEEQSGRILLFDRHHLQYALAKESGRIGKFRIPTGRKESDWVKVKPTDLYTCHVEKNGLSVPALLYEPFVKEEMGDAKQLVIPIYRIGSKFSRLVVQEGSFTFANSPGIDHWRTIKALLTKYHGLENGKGFRMIEIPAAQKTQVLRGLHHMGIHGASVFPDLQGVGLNLNEFAQFGDWDTAFRELYIKRAARRIEIQDTEREVGGAGED